MGTFLAYVISPLLVATLYNLITKKHVNENNQTKKTFLIYCGIIIFLMIGLRHYSVGSVDGSRYYDNWLYMSKVPFNRLGKELNAMNLEKGYLICVWLLSHIFPNAQFLFLIIGLFFAISICRFIYKNSEDVILSIMIFNCLGLFIFLVQGLRQGIAICICLYALEFCKKRKLIPFLLMVILAMTFHASALVFIIVYPIYSFQLNPKGIIIFTIFAIIGLLGLPYLFEIINYFIEDDYTIIGALDDGSGTITIFIYLAILIFALLFKKKDTKLKNLYALFVYSTTVGILSFLMRNYVSTIAERIAQYFAFGTIALVPATIKNLKDEKERKIMSVLVTILFLVLAIHKATYSPIIPYRFFWE